MKIRLLALVNPTPDRMFWNMATGLAAVLDGLIRFCSFGLFCSTIQMYAIMASIRHHINKQKRANESKSNPKQDR